MPKPRPSDGTGTSLPGIVPENSIYYHLRQKKPTTKYLRSRQIRRLSQTCSKVQPMPSSKRNLRSQNTIQLVFPHTLQLNIAGDGDCGETLVAGSNAILSAIKSDSLPLSNAVSGILALAAIVEDNMGGTSGALYSIYLSALAQGVAQSNSSTVTLTVMATAADFALKALGKYTPARVGDRTLVDALDPFVKELNESKDLWKAVEAAREGY